MAILQMGKLRLGVFKCPPGSGLHTTSLLLGPLFPSEKPPLAALAREHRLMALVPGQGLAVPRMAGPRE